MAEDKNKTNSRIGKRVQMISNLTVAPMRVSSQDIGKWRDAINAARNPTNPRRRLLNELYDVISLDGKYTTVLEKSKINITNKQFVFYIKGKEGDTVDRIQTEVIDTPWFDEMLEHLQMKKFWGHRLMEIVPGAEFPIEGINLIPPDNVIPETGELLKNYMDTKGIPFRGENADPAFKKFLIEYGKPKEYGLLMIIAQYVIYKRGGFGDLAQFIEIFGMPFRYGEYDPFDDSTRLKLESALKEMGGSGYAVIPQGTSIKFDNQNSGTGQSGVFKDMIELCNDEIAQIVLGGTMTTTDGSSYSQSKTHADGEKAIAKSDLKKILNWLNGPFKKKLIEFGYKEAANGKFSVDDSESLSLTESIDIDVQVAEQVEIEPEFWYNKYKVQVPKGGPKAIVKPIKTPNATEPVATKKKSKLSLALNTLYEGGCISCSEALSSISLSSSDDALRLAKLIYNKKLATGDIDKKLLKQTAAKLLEGIMNVGDDAFEALSAEVKKEMIENVYVFSGFKTYQQLKDASELLLDANGDVRSFADFKEEILKLDETYNLRYLNAEYNFAVSSGQMAVKWNNFQKEDYNLKFSTAGDDRVRSSHSVYDQMIRPATDEIWKTIWPPLEWECRCDVDQTTSETITDISSLKAPDVNEMFKGNVGIDGVVFPKKHPYFDASAATSKRITETALKLVPKK